MVPWYIFFLCSVGIKLDGQTSHPFFRKVFQWFVDMLEIAIAALVLEVLVIVF